MGGIIYMKEQTVTTWKMITKASMPLKPENSMIL